MKLVEKIAPVCVMGITSIMALGIMPNDTIVSDSMPKVRSVYSEEKEEVAVASNITEGLNSVDSYDELPSVDLPVVDVKIVNSIKEKINNVVIKSPSVGSLNIKGFKTVDLGEFKVRAYCSGKCCNQGGDAKGMKNYEGINVAVDPNIVPYGTMLLIEGVGIRQTQPSNQKVTGQEIRVYVSNHNKVKEFGEKTISIKKVL